ncbi:MAG: ABC transporter ATP-binding protein [Candidatus Aenigmarchaeota archaeon]|nr:ABC transporter ATP-binding protein [Candidatus Aenigmarchaeota archaeon]
MNAIEVNNVSKKFKVSGKEFYALKNVSLDVKQNEILGLLGPNGSGKTTLTNIIIGLLIADEGNVKLLGKDVEKFPDITEKIGLVSTDARFHWALSVNDVFSFFGMVYGLDRKERKKRADELMNFFGLESLVNRRVDALSTGEKMRLSFAKALMNNPKILLLDEPTLGLDPSISIKLRKEIKNINKEFGTPMLLTSHYMREVQQLANRVAFIYKGRIMDTRKVKGLDLEKYFLKMVKTNED